MNISIFEVTGPVMIGPSSSHTAGAARLARVARALAGKPIRAVRFGLHGSFARTGRGHGTDRALVAGALGLHEDDERLGDSFALAQAQGLRYEFHEVELEGVHENTVVIEFELEDGSRCEVTGSSVGGAQIVIRRIDGFEVEFTANSPALVLCQEDRPGLVSRVSGMLAEYGINIGVMKLSRTARGAQAFCVFETDSAIPPALIQGVGAVPGVRSVRVYHPEE